MIEAASKDLPARVRWTSCHSNPMATQDSTAVRISLRGVRTPRISTTPVTSGCTVFGLSVKIQATATCSISPQSRVPVRTKISFSSCAMVRDDWIGRTTSP